MRTGRDTSGTVGARGRTAAEVRRTVSCRTTTTAGTSGTIETAHSPPPVGGHDLPRSRTAFATASSRAAGCRGVASRWMVVLATARVSSALSLRRPASAGTEGVAQCFLVWHQVSQEVTAARSRFQVAGAQRPHSPASAWPISASAISASAISASGRSGPTRSMVRSIRGGVGAVGVGHRLVRGHVQRGHDHVRAAVAQLVGSRPSSPFVARAEKDRPARWYRRQLCPSAGRSPDQGRCDGHDSRPRRGSR